MAVEQKKYVTDTLVTIHKRMILNKRMAQGRSFAGEIWIQLLTTKTRLSCTTADSKAPRSLKPELPPLCEIKRECNEMTS